MMRSETPDEKRIGEPLELLTRQSRVLDAGVYDDQGDLVARSGEGVNVRDRLWRWTAKKLGVTSISRS